MYVLSIFSGALTYFEKKYVRNHDINGQSIFNFDMFATNFRGSLTSCPLLWNVEKRKKTQKQFDELSFLRYSALDHRKSIYDLKRG